ncbi:hypothetical protein EOPP23_15900 [Endozoicomonas sp. OPT23]|uniref:hypothetical protein n=1 Tax=Endozoicomonas sp. OPT23 TaxID=2072845 RepID=UPI00129AF4E1|nr:hypothetical protein [Endozoicomonas sp. OPT23]MRI34470.1 hypothetical protein [Endozoicomonas sp. OPT23]
MAKRIERLTKNLFHALFSYFTIPLLLIPLLFQSPPAQASNLIKLAHKAGFNKCDQAINAEFKDLDKQGNAIASTGYFNNRSFNIMATWGSEGDSVWKNTTFIKFGRSCLAYSVIGITYQEACSTYQKKNPEWSEIQKLGDFTWTKNEGGVSAIMKEPSEGRCEITYRVHQNYGNQLGKSKSKSKAKVSNSKSSAKGS